MYYLSISLFCSDACEAARNKRYSYRRGSAVVQIPASSVQMDLHVATQEPLGISSLII